MNERIKELLVQSGLLMNVSEHRVSELDPNIKKFAELIVQSILNSLETEREYYANPNTYQSLEYYIKMSAKEDALSDAISMIRSDFGVEK